MNAPAPKPTPRQTGAIDRLLARVSSQDGLRAKVPPDGRVFIDRTLPYLCLYRPPEGRDDPGTDRLVRSEAAYLIAPRGDGADRATHRLVEAFAERGLERFGAFLVVEIACVPEHQADDRTRASSPAPGFRLFAQRGKRLEPLLAELVPALEDIRILRHAAHVEVERYETNATFQQLLSAKRCRRLGVDQLVIQVQPAFRAVTGEVYPLVLNRLRRRLSIALRRGLHRHITAHAKRAPASYKALGRRTLVAAVRQVDQKLTEVAGRFDLLLEITPVNLESAWRRFRRQRFEHIPKFYYRPLPMDPALLKRQLFAVPVERIEDPTLASLMREKQLGLDRELSLLLDRGTRRFVHESLQIFGPVDDRLAELAQELLERIGSHPREHGSRHKVDAEAFAQRARDEVARYQTSDPTFATRVVVRDDIYPGLMVSRGDLLIGRAARFPPGRVDALLQHEIGTHALTYHNGRTQPLSLLAVGLPNYDELQEGLAVLSEHLVGGLSNARLRLLAGRVVAARCLTDGASLIDAYRLLTRQHGFSQQTAFTIAARVWRGGGLTKDAVYLRGLDRLLTHLGAGGRLEPLFVGKIAIHHIELIGELMMRGVLRPPPLRPACLDHPLAEERLTRLNRGASLLDLVE